MCEKLVPKKGTFFCADKVRCPLRQHLFIPHIWGESFVPLHPPYGTTLVCFSRCEDAKSVLKKIILFLADNIGSNVSSSTIGNTLSSVGLLNEKRNKIYPFSLDKNI